MTNLDTTGRTKGAGEHFWIAGKEYVWVVGETGQLTAQKFERDEFVEMIARVREASAPDVADPVAAEVFGDA